MVDMEEFVSFPFIDLPNFPFKKQKIFLIISDYLGETLDLFLSYSTLLK